MKILDRIYSLGIYHFWEGNYISVIVTKRISLYYTMYRTHFQPPCLEESVYLWQGGELIINKVWEVIFDLFIGILIIFVSVAVYLDLGQNQ